MNGYDLATKLDCHYFGPPNPAQDGGLFVDVQYWIRGGYAPAVEFVVTNHKHLKDRELQVRLITVMCKTSPFVAGNWKAGNTESEKLRGGIVALHFTDLRDQDTIWKQVMPLVRDLTQGILA